MTEIGKSLLEGVRHFYTAKVMEHGATARGVDWNSASSQKLRFRQLLHLVPDESSAFSVNDYGCGYGALVDYLTDREYRFDYRGFDISEAMIAAAEKKHESHGGCRFTNSAADLVPLDYTVASGIFNVKGDVAEGTWQAHVLDTLSQLAGLSTEGFAFNVLSSYADEDRKRRDLYYADPGFLFDHCKRRFSRWVAVLHDYGLYEFTLVVRKDVRNPWPN